MKKSLSVLLASAMVSSMFSSIAFAADLDTQAKLDALIQAGIFDKDGTGNGHELDAKMTREQLAKILAKLKGLNEIPGATPYSDVAADRWSAGFINAVSKANPVLMDGVAEGVFNPAGNVTLEQLATVAVRALNLQIDSSATVSGKVSDWAKGYVATAIKAGLISEKSDFTADALRSDLVETTYGAKEALDEQNEPAKVSVKEAKAVGAKKVQVTLDKAVDTTKATLTLKRGSSEVKTTAAWSDDKKSAVLTLTDVKLLAGEYTVTLGGLEESAMDKTVASFTAEDEKVVKIEFTNPSDTIAYAPKVRVPFAAKNQYGEDVSMSAGNFSVFTTVNNGTIKKTEDGALYVELKTDDSTIAQNVSQISINIYDNSHNVSASKLFKVGTAPYIAKLEVKEPKYSNGTGLSNVGDTARVPLVEYDQYGNVMVEGSGTVVSPSGFVTPNIDTFKDVKFEYNSDGVREAVVELKKKPEANSEATLSVYAGGASATTKLKLVASKVATKVEIVNDGTTFAEGDVDKYITLAAYDSEGNKLSADDIVQNAKDGKFTVTISGAFTKGSTDSVPLSILDSKDQAIVLAGEHKGKLHIKSVGKGMGYVFVGIYTTTGQNSTAQQNFNVSGPRYPVTMKLNGDDLAAKYVAGASSTAKLKLYDQNGDAISKVADGVTLTENGKSVTYDVYVSVLPVNAASGFTVTVGGTPVPVNGGIGLATDAFHDKEIKVATTGSATGSVEIRAALRKKLNGTVADESVKVYSKTVSVIDPAKENLTYSLSTIGDLYAAIDDKTLDGDFDNPASWKAAQRKEVVLNAKDQAGNKVAIDATTMIKSVTTSVYSIAQAGIQTTNADNSSTNKAYVIGNKPGTTKVFLTFESAKGETMVLSTDVTVKNEPITVSSLSAGNKTKVDTHANLDGKRVNALMDLSVKDQYGIEYKNKLSDALIQQDRILDFDKQLGVRYAITDIDGTGSVSIDADGVLHVSPTIKSFTVTAYAGDKTAMTAFAIKQP